MSKILPDGFVNTDIFSDFSVFTLNNTIIGQYAGKIIKGNNNVIIGNNACQIGININNSTFIGAKVGSKIINADNIISIGEDNSKFKTLSNIVNLGFNNDLNESSNIIKISNDRPILSISNIGFQNNGKSQILIGNYNSNIDNLINIGTSNISTINNSIIIGNSIINDRFILNIDNILCKSIENEKEVIYIACGAYKNIPIILGSSNNFSNFSSLNNLNFNKNFITSIFKIKNTNNYSISFKTNANIDLIYNFPKLPNYDYSYLTTDYNGNLNWIPIQNDMIEIINSSADIICKDLNAINIIGDGRYISSINIKLTNNTTDNLKEGIKNLYSSLELITNVLYNYLLFITTNDINEGKKNLFFSIDKYSSNFKLNLNEFTTDHLNIIERTENTIKYYSFNDYITNSYDYFLLTTTDYLKQGKSNIYLDSNKFNINFDTIKEGISNLYFNSTKYNYLISSNFLLKTTDDFKEGSSNIYYNSEITNFYINSNFNNLTTDNLIEGSNNLFLNFRNIYKYLSNDYPNTDQINNGIYNDFFNNISNLNKYPLISDNIREGKSNLYYKNQNDLIKLLTTISTTDNFKEGEKNFFYYEDRGISNFVSNIPNVIKTTDILIQGTSNKFIENNFYNNDLQINGFLKTNNLTIIDNPINFSIGIENNDLVPKIGQNTEVFNIYDYDHLFLNSHLSNIEIYYSNANPYSINPKVPFIIINNYVGVNTSNPKYNLDVDGTINCSDLIINNVNYSNISVNYDNLRNKLDIYNGKYRNIGIGTTNPIQKLHVVGNIIATGTISASFSDIRLKNKIKNIEKPFEIINNLEPFYYTPNELAKSYGFINDKKEIGLNAQEVFKFLPEIVSIAPFDLDENNKSKSGNNYLTISYERLVPILIQGLKDLKIEINDLKKRLNINGNEN